MACLHVLSTTVNYMLLLQPHGNSAGYIYTAPLSMHLASMLLYNIIYIYTFIEQLYNERIPMAEIVKTVDFFDAHILH